MHVVIRKFVKHAATVMAAVACAAFPLTGSAQGTQADARWQPWTGCWQPEVPRGLVSSRARASDAPVVCVVPMTSSAVGSAASVVTLNGGKIVAVDTLVASGDKRARSNDGCAGVERARWASDGHRLYLNSDLTCAGGTKRTSAGMFAMTPNGEWVNVEALNAGGARAVRVVHYAATDIPDALPATFAAALHENRDAIANARSAAGAPLAVSDIIDASHSTDSSVVAAWVLDRNQAFPVDAARLVALSDAGVPGAVTDAMVAVAYPKSFAVNGASATIGSAGDLTAADEVRPSPRRVDVMMMPEYSPYGFSPFGLYGFGYSPYGYSPYGYSPYGYSPYGYPSYGYSGYGGYSAPYAGYGGLYGPPVIVLKGSEPVQRGYVVKGRGYTQTRPVEAAPGSAAQARPTVSAPPPPPPPPSNSNQSSGRTAHERP